MGISFFNSVKESLFGKKNQESSAPEGGLKAYFVLEGTNADGDYVFVSKNEMPGRSVLCSDGSFYFIQMEDPYNKDALDEADRRSFFSVRYFVNKEDFDIIKREIATREEEIEMLRKKKKDLETLIDDLRAENEKLMAVPQKSMVIENLEPTVKQNPVSVETVAAVSGSQESPETMLETLEQSRKIFLDYEVSGLDEIQEKELNDILTVAFTRNVPKVQMATIADLYMQGVRSADPETYLRLAVFATCAGTIQEHAQELKSVPNRKEINREFLQSCVQKLKEYQGNDEYKNLMYQERMQTLEEQIAPMKQNYADTIENIFQQNSPNL